MRRTGLRVALPIVLLASAGLFLAGSLAERAATKSQHGPEVSAESEKHEEPLGESAEAAETEEARRVEEERLFGIDIESPLMVGVAVALMAGLAAAVVLVRGRWTLAVVVASTLVFAVLDLREALHQQTEGRLGIATVAWVVGALHLGAAGLAGLALSRAAKEEARGRERMA